MLFTLSLMTLFDISNLVIKQLNSAFRRIMEITIDIENFYITDEKEKILNEKARRAIDDDLDNDEKIYKEFQLIESSMKKFSLEIVRNIGYKSKYWVLGYRLPLLQN